MTIRWHDKPIDRLTADELRIALVEALDQAIGRGRAEPGGKPTGEGAFGVFALGMATGGFFCALALLLT